MFAAAYEIRCLQQQLKSFSHSLAENQTVKRRLIRVEHKQRFESIDHLKEPLHSMLSPNLHVPYFEQPSDSFQCGAACAEMVLGEIGVAPHGSPASFQSELFDEIQRNNHDVRPPEPRFFHLGSGPRALNTTLNAHYPEDRSGNFSLFSRRENAEFSEGLVSKIYSSLVAPIVLVYRQRHWVVVTRCDTDRDPSTSSSFAIRSFDVNNPIRISRVTCLEGYVANIAYRHWLECYLRPQGTAGGARYNRKFWAICGSDVTRMRARVVSRAADNAEATAISSADLNGQSKLIDPEAAIEMAKQALKDYELREREPWNRIFASAEPGAPRLVEELDRYGIFYYIVPWRNQEGGTAMIISVDATDGSYRESEVCPKGKLYLPDELETDELYELVIGKEFELPNQEGDIRVRAEGVSLYHNLVWQPCLESFSPHLPFYLITVGGHRLYVRLDGKVFTSLSTEALGC